VIRAAAIVPHVVDGDLAAHAVAELVVGAALAAAHVVDAVSEIVHVGIFYVRVVQNKKEDRGSGLTYWKKDLPWVPMEAKWVAVAAAVIFLFVVQRP